MDPAAKRRRAELPLMRGGAPPLSQIPATAMSGPSPRLVSPSAAAGSGGTTMLPVSGGVPVSPMLSVRPSGQRPSFIPPDRPPAMTSAITHETLLERLQELTAANVELQARVSQAAKLKVELELQAKHTHEAEQLYRQEQSRVKQLQAALALAQQQQEHLQQQRQQQQQQQAPPPAPPSAVSTPTKLVGASAALVTRDLSAETVWKEESDYVLEIVLTSHWDRLLSLLRIGEGGGTDTFVELPGSLGAPGAAFHSPALAPMVFGSPAIRVRSAVSDMSAEEKLRARRHAREMLFKQMLSPSPLTQSSWQVPPSHGTPSVLSRTSSALVFATPQESQEADWSRQLHSVVRDVISKRSNVVSLLDPLVNFLDHRSDVLRMHAMTVLHCIICSSALICGQLMAGSYVASLAGASVATAAGAAAPLPASLPGTATDEAGAYWAHGRWHDRIDVSTGSEALREWALFTYCPEAAPARADAVSLRCVRVLIDKLCQQQPVAAVPQAAGPSSTAAGGRSNVSVPAPAANTRDVTLPYILETVVALMTHATATGVELFSKLLESNCLAALIGHSNRRVVERYWALELALRLVTLWPQSVSDARRHQAALDEVMAQATAILIRPAVEIDSSASSHDILFVRLSALRLFSRLTLQDITPSQATAVPSWLTEDLVANIIQLFHTQLQCAMDHSSADMMESWTASSGPSSAASSAAAEHATRTVLMREAAVMLTWVSHSISLPRNVESAGVRDTVRRCLSGLVRLQGSTAPVPEDIVHLASRVLASALPETGMLGTQG